MAAAVPPLVIGALAVLLMRGPTLTNVVPTTRVER
jgi:hypothetical protein